MSGEGPVPREGEGRHPISPRHPQVNCRSCAYHHICGFTENVYWLLQKTQGQVRLFFLCPGCHAQHGSDSAGGREAAAWPSGFPSAYWMPRSRFLRGIPGFQKPPWSFLNADPPRWRGLHGWAGCFPPDLLGPTLSAPYIQVSLKQNDTGTFYRESEVGRLIRERPNGATFHFK